MWLPLPRMPGVHELSASCGSDGCELWRLLRQGGGDCGHASCAHLPGVSVQKKRRALKRLKKWKRFPDDLLSAFDYVFTAPQLKPVVAKERHESRRPKQTKKERLYYEHLAQVLQVCGGVSSVLRISGQFLVSLSLSLSPSLSWLLLLLLVVVVLVLVVGVLLLLLPLLLLLLRAANAAAWLLVVVVGGCLLLLLLLLLMMMMMLLLLICC